MRITFLKDYHYNGVLLSVGDSLTLSDEKAGEFVRRGICVAAEETAVVEPKPEPETAAVVPAEEKAVRRPGRPRSRLHGAND